ncbi:MAG TPA: flagellar biosynthesis protein FlhF, partial [Bacillales bacterium]|nr:flagellar biosynthesis protein FlhF [Bacillales bacterium]
GDKKYLLLAGPTGVGKTTTLAKLAAKAKLEDHKEIAFITADTYRIAAVDQLKAYADILKVPIEVAYSKEDFLKAEKTFSDCDLVFVDTAGRNFREPSYIDEMKKLIPFHDEMETWLVLSMTHKYSDLRAVYQSFAELGPSRSILTKMDETRSYGAAFNFWVKDNLAPAYLTNGQNVPDDLIPVSSERIAAMLSGVERDA